MQNAIKAIPIATATAGAVNITIPATGLEIYPQEATITTDGFIGLVANVIPSNATHGGIEWWSLDEDVVTVDANGLVTAVGDGSTRIGARVYRLPGSGTLYYANPADITVQPYIISAYDKLTIHDKDFVEEYEIDNEEIVELIVEKELGGHYGLSFTLPFDATNADKILPGKYIGCEDQLYFLENINTIRGSDGNPLLSIRATHIFFEIENRQAGQDVAKTGKLLDFLRELLEPFGISVSGIMSTLDSYLIERYVKYEAKDSVIDCIKKIFQPFFMTYRLDNLRLEVIPSMGDLFSSAITLEYAVNNESITKEADYSDILTKVYAEGDEITYTAEASNEIKNLYRQERERIVSFGGVSSQSDLKYLTDEYIKIKQVPHTTYRLSVAELKNISDIDDFYPGRDFTIDVGQRVKVEDSEFGFDVSSIILRYTYKPLEPHELSTIVVGDIKPYDLMFTEPDREEVIEEEPEEDDIWDDIEDGWDDSYISDLYVKKTGDTMTGDLVVNAMVNAKVLKSTLITDIKARTVIGHNDEIPFVWPEPGHSPEHINDDFRGVYIPYSLDQAPWDGIYNRGGVTAAARWKYDNKTYLRHDPDRFQVYCDEVIQFACVAGSNGYFGFDLGVVGNLTKGSGSFKITHPLDKNKNLYHGFIEGPKYDLIYRGKIRLEKGKAKIDIDKASDMTPGTFDALTQNAEVTSLHNKTSFSRLMASDIKKGKFTITCEDKTDDEVVWVVMAERNDAHVRESDRTDDNGRLVPEVLKSEDRLEIKE